MQPIHTDNLLPKPLPEWIKRLQFDHQGLIPAIAQDRYTHKILMVAWMSIESLIMTVNNKQATYYSRSRQKLWCKGEESGHTQTVYAIRTDCDGDVILLSIEQQGNIACHTGRESCFFYTLSNELQWQAVEPILKSPEQIYTHKHSCINPIE